MELRLEIYTVELGEHNFTCIYIVLKEYYR